VNRALLAAATLCLFAAPALADIRGAKCVTSDRYLPGGTARMSWTCSNDSPASPDPEALDGIALGYPDGWTVACVSQNATDSAGNAVSFSCSASGQTVNYVDNDGGPGEIVPGRSWTFSVNVTAPAAETGPQCVFYTLSGDGSGGGPHEIIECAICLPAIPTSTPTSTPTNTPTLVPTNTPTLTPTSTPTSVPTNTPTVAPTSTPTLVPTNTPTAVPVNTLTPTPTSTPTLTPTVAFTATPTSTATPTTTPTQEATPTTRPTRPPVPTNTPSNLPTPIPEVPQNIPMLDPRGLSAIAAIFAAFGILKLRMPR
jgi:hypothetical protein